MSSFVLSQYIAFFFSFAQFEVEKGCGKSKIILYLLKYKMSHLEMMNSISMPFAIRYK